MLFLINHPLAGEKIKVTEETMFKYHLKIMQNNNFSLVKNENTYS